MRRALIVVDVQYDFIDGSLAIPNAEEVIKPIQNLLDNYKFDLIVASQDYHPINHISFASRHPNSKPFTKISLNKGETGGYGTESTQDLWPNHCVNGTRGCEIEEGVMSRLNEKGGRIFRKGTQVDQDAYSAFASVEATSNSEPQSLATLLEDSQLDEVYVVGLATDYCVVSSTLDTIKLNEDKKLGWKVYVIKEGVRGVDSSASEAVLDGLASKGVNIIGIDEVAR